MKKAIKSAIKKVAAKKPIVKKAQNGTKAKPLPASRVSKIADSLRSIGLMKLGIAGDLINSAEKNKNLNLNPKLKENYINSTREFGEKGMKNIDASIRYDALVNKARKDSAAAANKKKNGGTIKKAVAKKVVAKKVVKAVAKAKVAKAIKKK